MNDEIITSYLLGKKAGGGGTPPVYQDKEVSITQNGETTITKDEGYDALNSVELTVAVPQPSGKINITQNGTDIDVSSYASADVNVPAGADLSEYFDSTVTPPMYPGQSEWGWYTLIKKIPEPITVNLSYSNADYLFYRIPYLPQFTINEPIGSANYMFGSSSDTRKIVLPSASYQVGFGFGTYMFAYSKFEEIDASSFLPEFTENGTIRFGYMFFFCNKLKKVNLSNFNITNGTLVLDNMFANCTALQEIDISSLDFTHITGSNMFTSVPTNCLIYVKDQTAKDWFTTNWSNLTNVQIKS